MTGFKLRTLCAAMMLLLAAGCGGTEGDPPDDDPSNLDGTDGGSDDEIAAGSRQFMEECTQAEDCATGVCHAYQAKGKSLCTQACSATVSCPSPSPGCNNQGVCKAP